MRRMELPTREVETLGRLCVLKICDDREAHCKVGSLVRSNHKIPESLGPYIVVNFVRYEQRFIVAVVPKIPELREQRRKAFEGRAHIGQNCIDHCDQGGAVWNGILGVSAILVVSGC